MNIHSLITSWQTGGNLRRIERSLGFLACFAYGRGDYPMAQEQRTESLALFREVGDENGMAWCLWRMVVEGREPDGAWISLAKAKTLPKESLPLFRETEDNYGAALALHDLASVARREGNLAEVQSLLEGSVSLFREMAVANHAMAWGA